MTPLVEHPDDVTEECWTGLHAGCSGYTEPEWDPDLCNCECHDELAEMLFAQEEES